MIERFIKYPSTPHIAFNSKSYVRDDKVMSNNERREFLSHEITVEEKVDGANLGISFSRTGELIAQNRGSILQSPYAGQWKKLSDWLSPRLDNLFDQLGDTYILFGEWCYAKHSIMYNLLPDWFLGFDIYDKKNDRFLSYSRKDKLFKSLDLAQVPFIKQGHFSLIDLNNLLTQSTLGNTLSEGIYLRYDEDVWLRQRAKLVHPAFIQSIEHHWSRAGIKCNQLKRESYSNAR